MVDAFHLTRNMTYYQSRQCSPQWRLFLGTLLAELASGSGTDRTLVFFRTLGRKMAKALPLAEQETLEALEAAINAHWEEMDWGWCQFSVTSSGGGIHIVHGAWPPVHCEQRGLAADAMAALISGAYEYWLKGQGGGVRVGITILQAEREQPLELRYGE